eukprot:scaffold102850_cov63-Phaeocystis_antarctica.AAC.4
MQHSRLAFSGVLRGRLGCDRGGTWPCREMPVAPLPALPLAAHPRPRTGPPRAVPSWQMSAVLQFVLPASWTCGARMHAAACSGDGDVCELPLGRRSTPLGRSTRVLLRRPRPLPAPRRPRNSTTRLPTSSPLVYYLPETGQAGPLDGASRELERRWQASSRRVPLERHAPPLERLAPPEVHLCSSHATPSQNAELFRRFHPVATRLVRGASRGRARGDAAAPLAASHPRGAVRIRSRLPRRPIRIREKRVAPATFSGAVRRSRAGAGMCRDTST